MRQNADPLVHRTRRKKFHESAPSYTQKRNQAPKARIRNHARKTRKQKTRKIRQSGRHSSLRAYPWNGVFHRKGIPVGTYIETQDSDLLQGTAGFAYGKSGSGWLS